MKGLYLKYEVARVDGQSGVNGKHEFCDYFVLDLTHDAAARAVALDYARLVGDDDLLNDLIGRSQDQTADVVDEAKMTFRRLGAEETSSPERSGGTQPSSPPYGISYRITKEHTIPTCLCGWIGPLIPNAIRGRVEAEVLASSEANHHLNVEHPERFGQTR